MAVRIKLVRAGAIRAHASVTVATGVWLSDIQVLDGENGLSVLFPECVEFERPDTRARWEQRILAVYREQAPAKASAKPGVAPLARVPLEAGPVTVIHTAGAARGNPGPGAAAAHLAIPGRPPIELAQFIESTTPTGAAYAAILMALREVERLKSTGLALRTLVIRGDAATAIKDFQGRWGVEEPALAALATQCRDIIQSAALQVTFELVQPADNPACALTEGCLSS